MKYPPTEGPTCRVTNPRTFKYEYIKTVHLTIPLNENSIDTKRALVEARRMTRDGREAMLILRRKA